MRHDGIKICTICQHHDIINNMKLNAREIVKVLLTRECVRQKELVEMLTQQTGEKYTSDGLSHKLSRGTISYNEVALIADLLGYDIEFIRREQH